MITPQDLSGFRDYIDSIPSLADSTRGNYKTYANWLDAFSSINISAVTNFSDERISEISESIRHPRIGFNERRKSDARSILRHFRDFKIRQNAPAHHEPTESKRVGFGVQKPKADNDETARVNTTVYRVLRDTQMAKRVKAENSYKCAWCDFTMLSAGSEPYIEGHHIRPLGSPHNGPDKPENIICACPNHHAMLDYGRMKIAPQDFLNPPTHAIGPEFIDYHNDVIVSS